MCRCAFVLPDEAAETAARAALQAHGVLAAAKQAPAFVHERLASYFLRDMAVFTAAPGARLGLVGFRWTQYGVPGWCARRWRARPHLIADCSASADYSRQELAQWLARHAGARLHPSTLGLEGGGFETNGRGLVIANEALLNSRNPGLPRAAMER
jgi:agmatine/peptidylarginine deiminase